MNSSLIYYQAPSHSQLHQKPTMMNLLDCWNVVDWQQTQVFPVNHCQENMLSKKDYHHAEDLLWVNYNLWFYG